ncbi:MAG: MiaB/RimO family radical SAM methylthiotransferase [Myxococcota bacterium]
MNYENLKITEKEAHNSSFIIHNSATNFPSGLLVCVKTFGCQMNVLDSELVHEQLARLGCRFVDSWEKADIVLLNTCSVRALSEHKAISRLGRLRARKERGDKVVVGVLGCMAERMHTDLLRANPCIDLLAGPGKLADVPQLVVEAYQCVQRGQPGKQVSLSNFRERKGNSVPDRAMEDLEALDALRSPTHRDAINRVSTTTSVSNDRNATSCTPASPSARNALANKPPPGAYVRITRGCNKFCAFCVVPRTRGPEAHRHPDGIVDEVKRLADAGVLEVTLLGQTINHYHYRHGPNYSTSFARLLFQIHEAVPHLPRLRFLTSYPRDFTDEALDVMAGCERICKYLHIPAQSGSDRILRRMNRGYTRDQYLGLIERARARMPHISIVGDMITGFPTETDEDHELSLSLLRQVRYKGIYVFKYSPRPMTVAHRRETDNVPVHVKQERNRQLLRLQRSISLEHHRGMIGQEFEVLVEGRAKYGPRESDEQKQEELIQIGTTRGTKTSFPCHPESVRNRSEGQTKDLLTRRSTPPVIPAKAGIHMDPRLRGGDKVGIATTRGIPSPVTPAPVSAGVAPPNVRLQARTRGDHIVVFDGPSAWIGACVRIRVTDATALTLRGEVTEGSPPCSKNSRRLET